MMHRGFYYRMRPRVRGLPSGPLRVYLDLQVRRVDCRRCAAVKRERLELLADNPFYKKRFAYYVGRCCRSATIKDIAEELRLDWDAVDYGDARRGLPSNLWFQDRTLGEPVLMPSHPPVTPRVCRELHIVQSHNIRLDSSRGTAGDSRR